MAIFHQGNFQRPTMIGLPKTCHLSGPRVFLVGFLLSQSLPLFAGIRQLFLDPRFLLEQSNVELHVNPVQSSEVVIRPDKPWEQFMITFYVSVLDEGGRLRMWYVCRDADQAPNVAYAESDDGRNWRKPSLGIVDYKGSRDNNLVGLSALEGNVFHDPHATSPDRAYIYVTAILRGGGIYCFASPDGLHWKKDARPLLPFEADSQNITFWDEPSRKYLLFFRGWSPQDPLGHQRKVVRLVADRLDEPLPLRPSGIYHPADPTRQPFIVNEAPTVLQCDRLDPDATDIYTNAIQRYPLAPQWFVGFPSILQHTIPAAFRNDGRTEAQFIASADGVTWQRFDRAAYVSPGLAGGESANMVYLGPSLIVRGDELWQYGTGFRTSHGDTEARKKQTDGAIFRHVQRVDGFVSLDFAKEAGRCLTRAVPVDGLKLYLNIDTGAVGQLRVGLYNDAGPLPGFGENDCQVLHGNSTRAVVTWKNGADLAALQGQSIHLLLAGARTKLYSARFE